MPTVIKTPDRYKCNVCGDTYDTEALAFACEDRPSRVTTEHERAVIKARYTSTVMLKRTLPVVETAEETKQREAAEAQEAAELIADQNRPPWKRRSLWGRWFRRISISDRDHIDHIESLHIRPE